MAARKRPAPAKAKVRRSKRRKRTPERAIASRSKKRTKKKKLVAETRRRLPDDAWHAFVHDAKNALFGVFATLDFAIEALAQPKPDVEQIR